MVDAGEPPSEDSPAGGLVDPRILAAWRQWLAALATDAEAAIAAGHVYEELTAEGRDAWLDALGEDGPNLAVPLVAIYAPLLSVESDPARLARIEAAIRDDLTSPSEACTARALRGIASDGARVAALITPLYLSFVRVLWCRYLPDDGFAWVRHDPILRERDAPANGTLVEDVFLETTPLKPVIEELAHAILAQQRRGASLPPSLRLFADLFDAHIEVDALP
jgi:hypothetical protein